MSKKTGYVYWANSRKIDKTDKKSRRQYAIIRDNGKYVKVSKIRGFNENDKNKKRLYILDMKKYPLTKPSGVDNYVYSRRSDNKKLLSLQDKQVFDEKPVFKLNSHDAHNVLQTLFTSSRRKKGRR